MLREQVRRHGGDDAEVKIVAAPAKVSRLKWFFSDVDEAREQAEEVATQAEEAVEPEASVEAVEVGDPDPVQAIQDALATFPADEIVIATSPESDASWLERDAADKVRERFGLPVRHLTIDRG